LQSGAAQWGLGPAVRLPWFDGGRLRAHLQGKQAELEGAVQSYNATLVEALKDVLDPLATLKSLDAQQAQQKESLSLAQRSYQLAKQRQESGLANTLQTLMAETQVIQQQRLSIELQSRRLDTEVALIRALGGGYQQENAP
jgi:outer membrane protein TolC